MQLNAIDEMNGKTSSASNCIVSEEFDVLEQEEIDISTRKQVDEIWKKNSLHKSEGLNLKEANQIIQNYAKMCLGNDHVENSQVREIFDQIDQNGSGLLS